MAGWEGRWGRAGWVQEGRLASRCVFKMDLRLGRGGGNGGVGAGVGVGFVYSPSRRVTVVRDRCSAGGGGGEEGFPRGCCTSSGWGSAGSLRVSVTRDVVVVVVAALVLLWGTLGWRDPMCS